MARYIDAEKLMHALGIADECKKCTFCIGAICTNESDFVDACTAIAEAPTADVVEVVRCKACVHWKHRSDNKHYCDVFDWLSTENDYCSFAERRTDEEPT